MAKGLYEKQVSARKLRQEGLSLNEIVARLSAAKSSVSLWVRDIELTSEQKKALQERNPACIERAGKIWSNRKKELRAQWQEEGRRMARGRDVDFIAGCMLYWAEGSKKRNSAIMTNTDENMMRAFVRFLRKSFGVSGEEIRVTVRFYSRAGLSVEDVEGHWGKVLEVPRGCFRKAEVDHDKRPASGLKIKYPWGTCRAEVNKTEIVQKIYGAIQEYAGFSDERLIMGT